MNCPECKIALDKQHVHGLTVNICPSCNSIWFDRGELELFKHQTDKEHLSKLDESAEFKQKSNFTVECPRCETKTLEMGKIRGYRAGRCSGCHGVWVNSGEMKHKSPKQKSSVKDTILEALWMAIEIVSSIFE